MKVEILRKGGLGIKGTYHNINCHAKKVESLVKSLWEEKDTYGFVQWKAGHNVHVAITEDGRPFCFYPINIPGEGYVGLRLFYRQSRSVQVVITSIYYDTRNGVTLDTFKSILKSLADVPIGGRFSGDKRDNY